MKRKIYIVNVNDEINSFDSVLRSMIISRYYDRVKVKYWINYDIIKILTPQMYSNDFRNSQYNIFPICGVVPGTNIVGCYFFDISWNTDQIFKNK